jgi:ABC-type glutathione transport system ATPase component
MDQAVPVPVGGVARAVSSSDLNDLSLRSITPVSVAVKQISVVVKEAVSGFAPFSSLLQKQRPQSGGNEDLPRSEKTILDKVSCDLPAGTLTAIIGGSGSGKTTL